MKKTLLHLMPVIAISLFMMFATLTLCEYVSRYEEQQAWTELRATAEDVSDSIVFLMESEISKLKVIQAIMVEDEAWDEDDSIKLHLDLIQPATIFSRIDILFPDNTLLINGRVRYEQDEEDIDFAEVVAKGEYMTQRKQDFLTGKDCVYYVMPVERERELFAVLIGVLPSKNLLENFQPNIYGGEASIALVDTRDGNYILDSWHEKLGNIYDMQDREKLKGYEDYDAHRVIPNQETGTVAFVSKTTGNPIYMYYCPAGIFDWELILFAEDHVFFGDMIRFRQVSIAVVVIEVVLLILYFIWNSQLLKQLERSLDEVQNQKQQLRYLSYRDLLTGMYNRNCCIERTDLLRGQQLSQVGVAYLDLNGLKQRNDDLSHEAGDQYIRSAAQCILSEFPEDSYRVGGDEFMVFTLDMAEADFLSRMTRVQDKFTQAEVSISSGFLWQADCDDLEGLLKQAETKMYEAKQQYYRTHDRRR